MTRISDDIRKWCNLCGGIIDSGDKAELRDLVDRLDAELVELPKDTGDGYFCWYSRGDTAANTPTDYMHKLDNAGWTKIEQMYDDAASAAEHS